MAVNPVGSRGSSGLAYYAGPEEYVVALHDFTSANDTCLSFQAGQVIKVYNRDSSGWWDGELDGLRGWFPSNYVDQDGLLSTSSNGGRLSSLATAEDDDGGGGGGGVASSSYHPVITNGPGGSRISGVYEGHDEEYARKLGNMNGRASSSMSPTSATPGSAGGSNSAGTSTPQPSIPRRSSSQNQSRRHLCNGSNEPRSPHSPSDFDSILEPILHAIALLNNAVRANRLGHFQPSTACVISSVRSVLSATDCLTRDSAVLKAHPVLARERKQILSELTRLVQQSKRASDVTLDESERGPEMEHMLELADLVLGHVRRFLEVADECGVPIPDRRTSLYEETYEDRRGGIPIIAGANANGHGQRGGHANGHAQPGEDGRSMADNRSSAYYTTFTSGQFSPRSSRSFADLRSTHSRSVYVNSHEDDAGLLGVGYVPRSEYRNTMRTTHTTASSATTAAQYHGQLTSSPPDSLQHGRYGTGQGPNGSSKLSQGMTPSEIGGAARVSEDGDDSIEEEDISAVTQYADSSAEAVSGDASVTDGIARKTPAQVLDRLSTANDELLSVIAAFIGHVHTHTRSSHASSFAHLIDMTREAVDAVRNLLTVVEAVNNHPELQAQRKKEVSILWETRESLYEATTALVTSARVVTASGAAPASSTATGGDATPPTTEDDEKSRLLSSATGVLRTGGECVGAVRLCLGQADPAMLIAVPEPTQSRSQSAGQHAAPRKGASHKHNDSGGSDEIAEDDDENGHEGVLDGGVTKRGKHTLSFLGRKATSLSCLREKYEHDGYQAAFDGILEDGDADREADAEDNEVLADMKRRATVGTVDPHGSAARSSAGGAAKPVYGSRTSSNGSAMSDGCGKALPDSPTAMQNQQDSSPDIDIGGNVVSSGRFDGPARSSGVSKTTTGNDHQRHSSRLVLPNGKAGASDARPSDQVRRNSGGTSSDGDGSRVSNNSASTSAASLTGSTSLLSRSARSGSEATMDTSARPSLEQRRDSDFASPKLDSVPHSAPLMGKFPREMPPGSGASSALSSSSANTPSEDGTVQGFGSSHGGITQSMSDSQLETTGAPDWARRGSQSTNEPIYMQPDYDPEDVVFKDGTLRGATLAALVEKMTPHDTTVDSEFSTVFYTCFRLFTTPTELCDAFIARFNLQLPPGIEITEAERTVWLERKVTPVRLRVLNFFKVWLEAHYQEATDAVVLPKLVEFARTCTGASTALGRQGQRLADLAQRRLSASGIRAAGNRGPGSLQRAYSTDLLRPSPATQANRMYLPSAYPRQGVMPPQPLIKDKLMASLRTGDWRSINIMEIDPLELARQLTIMGSKIFCSISADELLNHDTSTKKAAASAGLNPGAANGAGTSFIKMMTALSTAISGWVNEAILSEEDVRKRVQLLKFFIKLGDRFLSLQNFDALIAIHAALGSSQIDRLRQTWDALPAKYRTLMDQQRPMASFARNWAVYRARVRAANPPALPFLGIVLTDLTFVTEGNARMRPSAHASGRTLLNFDRYVRLTAAITELQRFQVPYNLLEVPEMQSLLKSVLANLPSSNGIDPAGDLYERSKALEPRVGDNTISGRGRDGNNKGLDIFNWK